MPRHDGGASSRLGTYVVGRDVVRDSTETVDSATTSSSPPRATLLRWSTDTVDQRTKVDQNGDFDLIDDADIEHDFGVWRAECDNARVALLLVRRATG